MAGVEKAAERPLDYKEFKFTPVDTHTELFDEITASVSFTFGRSVTQEFRGPTLIIMNNDKDKLIAESFLEASQKAWNSYKNSSDESRVLFVQDELLKQWKKLNGEVLTNKKLEFI